MRINKRPYIEETRQKRPQTATDPHLNDNQAPPIRINRNPGATDPTSNATTTPVTFYTYGSRPIRNNQADL